MWETTTLGKGLFFVARVSAQHEALRGGQRWLTLARRAVRRWLRITFTDSCPRSAVDSTCGRRKFGVARLVHNEGVTVHRKESLHECGVGVAAVFSRLLIHVPL